jgi:dolichol-phosphate mannosyltransferase
VRELVTGSVRQHLTILCPVFNEEAVVPLFFERMKPVMDALAERYEVNLTFINNASTDGTLDAIERLRAVHPHVFVLSLSTNVGYQRSLESGLRTSKGDLFAFIDVDCEDPPRMILDFVAGYEEGYDIVYGERVDRPEAAPLKLARKFYYRFTSAVADEQIVLDMAEFSLMTREVRDAIVEDSTSFPFIRASIGRVGFKRKGIPYRRAERIGGKTHYNLFSMVTFGVAGILSSSTLPLRLTVYVLPFWLLVIVGLSAVQISSDTSWAIPTILVLFCGYVGVSVAFIAAYVARIYKNTLGRPNYYIDHSNTVLEQRPDEGRLS